MNNERLALRGRLEQVRKDFEEASNTADDIVKTIINHIRPIAGTGTDYLDEINSGKFEVQAKHLVHHLMKRSALQQTLEEIQRELD